MRCPCRNMKQHISRSNRFFGQDGQALYLIVAFIVVLMGFASLGVDVSMLWATQLRMQTAADAGAVAAANALNSGIGTVSTAAKAATTQNGFTNGAGTAGNTNLVTVTINNPPKSGNYTSNAQAVEVIVQQSQPTFFMRVAGFSTVAISARAVALPSSGQDCIYALDPSASGALQVNGSAQLGGSCGVLVNSTSSSAISSNSSGTVTCSHTGCVGKNSGVTCTPHEVTGIAAFSDPLATLPTPSTSSKCTKVSFDRSGNATCSAGNYYCATTIGLGQTVTLGSGVVSFDSITIQTGGTLNGSGSTIYLKSGSCTMSSWSQVNLSAPTSGTYAGILFFQDRSNSTAATLNSGTGVTMTGSLYFPAATVNFNGNGWGTSGSYANNYSIVVADKVILNSGTTLSVNNDYSSLVNGSPIKEAVLVE